MVFYYDDGEIGKNGGTEENIAHNLLRAALPFGLVSFESNRTVLSKTQALRIVTVKTFPDWLTGYRQPMGKSLEKLRMFSKGGGEPFRRQRNQTNRASAAENRAASPTVALRSALSLLPKARGEIRKLGAPSFQGVCPKCGASGPKRESHQEALKMWKGRE